MMVTGCIASMLAAIAFVGVYIYTRVQRIERNIERVFRLRDKYVQWLRGPRGFAVRAGDAKRFARIRNLYLLACDDEQNEKEFYEELQ